MREDIAECERIQVKAGDIIGVFFPHMNLGLQWDKCQVEEQPYYRVVRLHQHEERLRPGSVGHFEDYGCLKLSLRATVGPVESCTLPPLDDKAEKVTSGDSVDVGQEVEYQCKSGFQLLSGDLKRRCGPCRKLEGIPPMCGGGWAQ